MIYSLRKTAVAALLVLAATLGNQAKADLINGTINFGGDNASATTNTGTLSTATSFTAISGVEVAGGLISPTGAYAGLAGNAVSFTPFSFSASGVSPLWTFSANFIVYSFEATTVNIVTQTANFLNLSGSGIAYIKLFGFIDLYEATEGTWSITQNSASGIGPSFTFSASSAVPDGGTTAMLIGVGLVGIALASRRLTRTAQVSS